MVDKEKIIAKVRALFNKTVQNGATEEEAMQATIKAHELLLKYQIEFGALEIKTQGTIERDTPKNTTASGFKLSDKNLRIKWWLTSGVAEYCDCKAWGPGENQNAIRFLGTPSDVEFALWLIDSLAMFTVSQMNKFMLFSGIPGNMSKQRWEAKKSFVLGCCSRITKLLNDAKGKEAEQPKMSDGRSLIVLKNQLVEEEYAQKKLKLRDDYRGSTFSSKTAFAQGYVAGGSATIGRPIEGHSNVVKLRG